MIRIITHLLFTVSLMLIPLNRLRGEDLFFTYTGVSAGGGIDYIEYKDWFADEEKTGTKDISGNYIYGGAMIDIFVDYFIGEFSLNYIRNSNDEVPVSHLFYTATGKYACKINGLLELTAGIGLYLETPPASESYNSGGGVNGVIGTVFNIGREWKFIFDFTGRYGHFGIGEDSTRYSFGANLGALYKVGRI